MTRHSWSHASADIMECRKSASSIWARAMVDCNGCGATVPADRIYVYKGMTGEQLRHEADTLWHNELRPLAGLVKMVEEANDSPA